VLPDAADFAPCAVSARIFYVVGEPGNPVVMGPASLIDSQATWNGQLAAGQYLDLVVTPIGQAPDWQLVLMSPITAAHGLIPGTYDGAGLSRDAPVIGVSVAGRACADLYGSFTIYDIQDTGGDSARVTRVLTSFDVRCPDAGGAMRGCVRYEE
jgi:hypothetical protein